MLTVGINTYATVEDADAYVEKIYIQYDPLRVYWLVLEQAEKEQYLSGALRELERLPFIGRKWDWGQALQFPRRKMHWNGIYPPGYPFILTESDEVPELIKEAQTEEALALMKRQINSKQNKRQEYDSGILPVQPAPVKLLESEKAYQMLRPWLGGVRC